jgi:hypothetical protein
MMKLLKCVPLGMALAASLVGASSSAAANWDPQGVSLHAVQVGTGSLTSGSATVSCGAGTARVTASGDLATATGTHNPASFTSCNASPFATTTTVTTTGTWTFTATSTTDVDITAVSASGSVADITIGHPAICHVTVPSPVHLTSTWSNSTGRLSTVGSAAFPITSSGFGCGIGGIGTTARLETTFQLPAGTIIT